MKTAGLLAVGVAAAAVLALPAVLGGMTEAQANARIAEINEGEAMRIEVNDYSRGWFSSTAQLDVRLSPELLARMGGADVELPAWLADTALPVRLELAHGPAGVQDGPFLGYSKVVARPDPGVEWVRDLTARYNLPYLFEFRAQTGLSGRVSFNADVPPVDTTAGGGSAKFSGAWLEGTLDGNHVVAALDVERFDLDSPALAVALAGVRASTDMRLAADYRSTGEGAFEIAELSIGMPAGATQPLALAGVRFASAADLEGGAWTTRFDYSTDSVRTPDGQRIESAALGIGVDGLDAGAVDDLRAVLDSSAAGAGAPVVAPAAVVMAMNEIIAGAPTLEITPIRFTLNGDALDANVRLDVGGAAAPLNLIELTSSPLGWTSLVNGTVEATIAKPLARRFAADAMRAQLAQQQQQQGVDPGQSAQLAETQASLMLVMLAGQGYLTETENAYATQIRLTDGAVTINGQSLPTAGLQ